MFDPAGPLCLYFEMEEKVRVRQKSLGSARPVPIQRRRCPLPAVCFPKNLIPIAVVGVLAFVPGRLPAAASDRLTEGLAVQAQDLEKQHRWLDACRSYDDLLRKDREQSEYRDGYQRCLRHYYLSRRHQDAAYRQAVAKLTPGQALDVYEQVLTAVGTAYFDRPRAEIPSLFQNGVRELEIALDEPAFRNAYLPDADANPEGMRAFREQLATWRSRKVASRSEARDSVLAVARAAQEAGLAPKQSSLVPAFALEFACGGCNALDEYTLFVTPGHDLAPRSKNGPTVRHEMLAENFSTTPGGMPMFTGLITISQFQESTPQEMREALFDLTTRGARGLILDLRGNPGGLFKAAVQVAELFVGEGVIVHSQGQIKEYNQPFEARGGHVCLLPVVVLVDAETASSAEVLAGALKELGRARLVGQQTFGKGSIQAVIPLDRPPLDKTPAAIRLTVAKLLSPAKQPYSGRGVTPDVEVPGGDDSLEAGKSQMRSLLNAAPVPTPG
jgi:Peptidase family S41